MALTAEIKSYWANNSRLTYIIPATSFFLDIIPEGTQPPIAILKENKISREYTTGDSYIITYRFTIQIWTNDLATTNQYAAIVVSQFQAKKPVQKCGGCWCEDDDITAEEHDQMKRYGYGRAIRCKLITTRNQNQVLNNLDG